MQAKEAKKTFWNIHLRMFTICNFVYNFIYNLLYAQPHMRTSYTTSYNLTLYVRFSQYQLNRLYIHIYIMYVVLVKLLGNNAIVIIRVVFRFYYHFFNICVMFDVSDAITNHAQDDDDDIYIYVYMYVCTYKMLRTIELHKNLWSSCHAGLDD